MPLVWKEMQRQGTNAVVNADQTKVEPEHACDAAGT